MNPSRKPTPVGEEMSVATQHTSELLTTARQRMHMIEIPMNAIGDCSAPNWDQPLFVELSRGLVPIYRALKTVEEAEEPGHIHQGVDECAKAVDQLLAFARKELGTKEHRTDPNLKSVRDQLTAIQHATKRAAKKLGSETWVEQTASKQSGRELS